MTKKEKLIEEAQKLALRGQLDKAAKVYEQVLAIDPAAINQRQRLADLLVRLGRPDDARREFETIGKQYTSNGFYQRAIAIYTQIQRLFPNDVDITLTLANLNEKHGLIGNAIAEYKKVFIFHEKSGNMPEALKILEAMQKAEPLNVNIRLKLAETLHQSGKTDDSYAAFGKLASMLQERGDMTAFNKLITRIQQLFPDKTEFVLEVLTEQVRGGNTASAVISLQALLRTNPHDVRIWNLIVEAYTRLDQPQRVRVACQHFLRFFPNELAPRKGLLKCCVTERDLKKALLLLESYEQDFFNVGAAGEMLEIYTALDEIDPINQQVMEGMKRTYEQLGDFAAAELLAPKIGSLQSLSASRTSPVESDSFAPELFLEPDYSTAEGYASDLPDQAGSDTGFSVVEEGDEAAEIQAFTATLEAADNGGLSATSDEIEIEIEIDDGLSVESSLDSGALSGEDWLGSVGELFDSIASSPRGVKFAAGVETADAQAHYDLGVAFKEMGLFDEAINEFSQAAGDQMRRVECLVLQGACLREKGDLDNAENVLRALHKQGLSLEDTCAVKYELALTCNASGKLDEAASLLAEIDTIHPGFRDVRSRLDAGNEDELLDFSDEDLSGFDLK